MLSISHLFVYPIKSLGGISVSKAKVTDRGLGHDRRWMLVDEDHRFLTQREHPQMALLKTAIAGDQLSVFDGKNRENEIVLPLQIGSGEKIKVTVWDDICDALLAEDKVNEWFSERLSLRCKLVFMPDGTRRAVDPRYARSNEDVTSFSDAYPILMISQASLDFLNAKLAEPVPMNRFRPNIVFTGGEPHCEDEMQQFRINEAKFSGVKLCSRCVLTTTDQETGFRGKEPLKTLASYRTISNKVCFGQNVIGHGESELRVGDEIVDG